MTPFRERNPVKIGAVSLAVLAAFCLIYFGLLGYPLPRIERYHGS